MQERDAHKKGLVCPACGCRHFYVVYTRRRTSGAIIRRRECRYCGKRLTTVERPMEAEPKPPM